ncbi:MFS general substrate transporter [Irpex rosettiformis]|uniref:MFS general substrate transporter n=1 Tax=Irpex rosettiformis TaxID=378272 RepID=A0ACB8UDX0_9APHY|nr:MFS general substrate transporter [Irpex rosettiformis]
MAHPSPSSLNHSQDKTTPPSPTTDLNHHHHSNLEEYEESTGRPPFILTYTEVKLLGIAGVGFFLDAYDLFIINPVATMLQYRLYGGKSLPSGLEGFMKAGANIGSVIGQFGFGFAADYFGRKAVYGKELMLIIFATIMSISDPTGDISPSGALIWLAVWRIILGIGVGGDYPMSASVTTDRARIRRRGTLLAYIFANQGWGSLVGSLVVIIVLSCYKHTMDVEGHTSKVDGVWRICVGLSLIPAFGTLYQRLTLPESTRFKETRKAANHEEDGVVDEIAELKKQQEKEKEADGSTTEREVSPEGSQENSGIEVEGAVKAVPPTVDHDVSKEEVAAAKSEHFNEFFHYFSEWRHLRILMGTSISWFLLDIAFYGINLNQNVVLQQIGFDGKNGTPWNRLFKISVGNIIITVLGFVPGYYVTVLTVEKLGRKWIQTQGFLMAALFLAILAGKFHTLSKAGFVVCFAFLQFFFNFGANSTTYIVPAGVFPTKFRAAAHGMSAASGKAGAIISALAFNELSKKLGTPAVLWIFFGCCIFGAAFTQLLPESKGYDPDAVYAQEVAEAQAAKRK